MAVDSMILFLWNVTPSSLILSAFLPNLLPPQYRATQRHTPEYGNFKIPLSVCQKIHAPTF
jgi:hypothetical protein